MKYERILAENPQEILWLRYRRLLSSKMCEKIISSKGSGLSSDVVAEKADGVASAVGAAIGYWESKSDNLNSWIVSRYYALMHLTIAEQVASSKGDLTLKSVQRHTEYGHGIGTWRSDTNAYPENHFVYLLRSGYFISYLKFLGFSNINDLSQERRIKEEPTDEQSNLMVDLGLLLRTIPELEHYVEEYLDKPPLSISIAHSSHNMSLRFEELDKYNKRNGGFAFEIPEGELGSVERTYIDIYPSSTTVTTEYIKSMGLPLEGIELTEDEYEKGRTIIRGYLEHPRSDPWYSYIRAYRSNYCGTSLVSPVLGDFDDIIIIHFLLLYALSIAARYLPDVWRDITVGEQSHIAALIEHYLSVVDKVIPLIMLERITGIKIALVQPGTMNAPA